MRRMFDRKNLSYKLFNNDIEHLPNDLINELKVGDMLVKEEHNYIVTYKGDTGICMTYHDASVVETVSYDLIDGVWTFNSKDVQGLVPYMDDIVDDSFNKRFVEGEATLETVSGVNITYNKWSLSGTHLMLVLNGKIENATTIASGTYIAIYDLPQYIVDKVVSIYETAVFAVVDQKTINVYADDSSTQAQGFALDLQNNQLKIRMGSLTTTRERYFKIQFDLLIDAS